MHKNLEILKERNHLGDVIHKIIILKMNVMLSDGFR
jgi:hypothetical protein